MMHTKDKLALALEAVNLRYMAGKARMGYYHDFLSPIATPATYLIADLAQAAVNHPAMRARILSLRLRVMDGEFDASEAEAEAWVASPEGQEAFGKLKK